MRLPAVGGLAPADRGEWAAMRPAESVPPGPEAPMVWVRAGTAGELEKPHACGRRSTTSRTPRLDAATKPPATGSGGPRLILANPLWELAVERLRDAEPWISCGEQGLGSIGQYAAQELSDCLIEGRGSQPIVRRVDSAGSFGRQARPRNEQEDGGSHAYRISQIPTTCRQPG